MNIPFCLHTRSQQYLSLKFLNLMDFTLCLHKRSQNSLSLKFLNHYLTDFALCPHKRRLESSENAFTGAEALVEQEGGLNSAYSFFYMDDTDLQYLDYPVSMRSSTTGFHISYTCKVELLNRNFNNSLISSDTRDLFSQFSYL